MIVADDAFPLRTDVMKPYSQVGLTTERRIFKYRLIRARRIVENAFGILSNRFRIFMTPIALSPKEVEIIVMACCSLPNYLRGQNSSQSVYTPQGTVDSEDPGTHAVLPGCWRSETDPQGLHPILKQGSNMH